MKKLLVTGSGGLIGSEAVAFFAAESAEVHGIDNNLRADFFGWPGDTSWNTKRLRQE
jgi:CDP-paratose 2-epimerase